MTEHKLMADGEVADLLEPLVRSWRRVPPEITSCDGVSPSQLAMTFTLSAHTHRLATAVMILRQEGHSLESMPLVRAAYEHALLAQFVALCPEGPTGISNSYMHNRKKVIETITNAGWQGASELADQLADWTETASPTTATATQMKQLCDDLEPGGDQAYAIYRILCGLTHPGAMLMDLYVEPEPFALAVDPIRFDSDDVPWFYVCCVSAVWAGSAVDLLTKSHPRQAELHEAAQKLGIGPEFKLSSAFQKRAAKAAKRAESNRLMS